MTDTAALEKRLSKMASSLAVLQPFVGAVFAATPRVVVSDHPVYKTAACSESRFYFDVDFCAEQDDAQLFGLCLHEGMHMVLMHPWRLRGKHPEVANDAADALINQIIKEQGYELPPNGVFIDWVTTDMSVDEIYARLMKEQPPQGSGGNCGDREDGDDDGWGNDVVLAESDVGAKEMEAKIGAAAKMAKASGVNSPLLDRILGGELAATVSWSEVLRYVVTERTRNDYTYARMNRRMYAATNLYLPSLYDESIGGLIVAVDTSGSVGADELEQMAGEIRGIVADCNPSFVEVVYCDYNVTHTERFEPSDPLILHPKGGGGTAFKPVFDYVEGLNERIAALIYFTDLCGNTAECPRPEYPVIWGCTYHHNNTAEVPFGTVVPVVI